MRACACSYGTQITKWIASPPSGSGRSICSNQFDGAPLLLAFQAGDGGEQHLARAYGHDVDLPVFRHDPDVVVGCLARAGLAVRSTTVRAPELPERTAQVYVAAVREEHR